MNPKSAWLIGELTSKQNQNKVRQNPTSPNRWIFILIAPLISTHSGNGPLWLAIHGVSFDFMGTSLCLAVHRSCPSYFNLNVQDPGWPSVCPGRKGAFLPVMDGPVAFLIHKAKTCCNWWNCGLLNHGQPGPRLPVVWIKMYNFI